VKFSSNGQLLHVLRTLAEVATHFSLIFVCCKDLCTNIDTSGTNSSGHPVYQANDWESIFFKSTSSLVQSHPSQKHNPTSSLVSQSIIMYCVNGINFNFLSVAKQKMLTVSARVLVFPKLNIFHFAIPLNTDENSRRSISLINKKG
jgi:hypothetical protein